MGKISNVYYEEIDRNRCSMMTAGEFYYHYNLMSVHPRFVPDYEAYEMQQISIRNNIIGNALDREEIPRHPKLNTTIFGISSIKNKSVIVTEY